MIPSSLYPLVTALLSNILAQVLKTVVYYYRTGKWDFHWVLASGGFPSSHSSTVTALPLSIFAVTTIFSFIVMYDACHVRYYSGKNIELTQQLVKDLREMTGLHFDDPIYQEKLKNVLGHKFVEVIGGFVVGLAVPLILCPLFL